MKPKTDPAAAETARTTDSPAVVHERLVRHLNVRIRLLADGRYVAEERRGWWIFETWKAIDWKDPQFLWSPNSEFYKDCIGDYQQVLKGVAGRGHSLPNAKELAPPLRGSAATEIES